MATLKSIKLATEAGIPGIEFVKRDGSIYEVIIGKLRITSQYGLTAAVEQPYETVKRYRVTATVKGFGTKVEYFPDYPEAIAAEAAFTSAGIEATRDHIEVLVDEAGNIVDAPTPAAAVGVTDDQMVPF